MNATLISKEKTAVKLSFEVSAEVLEQGMAFAYNLRRPAEGCLDVVRGAYSSSLRGSLSAGSAVCAGVSSSTGPADAA